MLKSRVILVLVAVVAGSVGLALGRRPAETAGAAAPSASSPYAADSSPVRGLTAREVDDLLNGRGAGFARTAELNGHPGPRHAIDLADDLELTDDQRAAAERIFAGMSAAAKRLGVEIVGRERRLSAAFAARRMTAETLRSETESLGVLYGRLRAVHLSAHLELTHVLTLPQIRRYDVLRGYLDSGGGQADTHVHRD